MFGMIMLYASNLQRSIKWYYVGTVIMIFLIILLSVDGTGNAMTVAIKINGSCDATCPVDPCADVVCTA